MNVKPEDLARIDQIVDDLCLKLQRRTVVESSGIAYETAQSMNEIIRLCRFQYSDAYIKLIRDIGAKLQSAQPIEFTVTNVVRRVLYRLRLAIKEIKKARETAPPQSPASSTTPFLSQSASCLQCKPGEVLSESYDFGSYDVPHMPQPLRGRITDVIAAAAAGGVGGGVTPPSTSPVGAGGQNTSPSVIIQQQQQAGSLTSSLMGNFAKLFYGNSGECGDSSSLKLNKTERVTLRNAVTEFIEKELVPDIKGVSHDIRGSRDSEQVHPSEIIMVYGGSNTVREYLINRSIKLSGQGGEFEVYVAEAAPSYNGHRMAADLAYGGIKTTLIPDTAICAMMSRVNKVIVGVHAIMANGGLVAQAGLHAVALAAKAHSVPLVIVASTFKITPVFPNNKEFLASMDSPAAIFPIDKSK